LVQHPVGLMAVSDPTMSVPTPTGTLQGVAAFSWDGSAWQPSGRAGPGVGTPTGVLRGVAPFSWDGAAWQPAGRAGPGVATPTGVLDGVAVYTWSGSAWTPTSGTATPSTPSGALRGVAAFSWDGAAWQPAGQAGPSVATPYGVLAGVAMFEWSGSTWQAGAAVPTGATLDLSFLSGPPLDPRLTFTRASTATYFNAAGTMQTAAINTPRFDYDPVTLALRGLLIEEQRTNIMQGSAAIISAAPWGVISVNSGASVLAPDGTTTGSTMTGTTGAARLYQAQPPVFSTQTVVGSVWLKAAAPVTARIGLGSAGIREIATQSVSVTTAWQRFTVTATGNAGDTGNISFSIYCSDGTSGNTINAWGAQTEVGAFATSYIPTTAAAVMRSRDYLLLSKTGWFVPPGGSWMAEYIRNNDANAGLTRIIGMASGDGSTPLFVGNSTYNLGQYDGTTFYFTANGGSGGAVARGASTWQVGQSKLCLNGGAVATSAAMTIGYVNNTAPAQIFQTDLTAESVTGYIRRVRYWPRVLSNSELQSVTT